MRQIWPRDTYFTAMKKLKSSILLILFLTSSFVLLAQTQDENKINPKSQLLNAGLSVPIGEFSKTHSFGISLEYLWSKNRLGEMSHRPSNLFGFIAKGGIEHYFGKSISTIPFNPSFTFEHYNFTYIKTYGGFICNLNKGANINLSLGPALGIEKNYKRIWWGVDLSASYYVGDKWAISPVISFMKDSGSEPIISAGIKGGLVL